MPRDDEEDGQRAHQTPCGASRSGAEFGTLIWRALSRLEFLRRQAPGRPPLIAALLGPAEPELTCEECFEQIDRYVDLALAGADAERAVPGMRAHLAGYPACLEDYASLVEYVASGVAGAAQPPPALPPIS